MATRAAPSHRNLDFDVDGDDFDPTSMDFGAMDNINFDDVDADLANFHKDEIVKEALARGVDLGVYSKQIARDLELAEAKTIQDYVSQADNLAELHYELSMCDSMLEKMEKTLSTFQHDLSEISTDIESLQTQSISIALELRNTTAVEKGLSQFLQHAYIAPDLINIILRDPFAEKQKISGQENTSLVADLVKALEALSRKIYVQQLPTVKNTKAAQETEILLEQLFHRAYRVSQQGLMAKISSLRKPNINIQAKQFMLLKLRSLYTFLVLHSSLLNPYKVIDAAADIRNFYVENMGSVYFHLFKNYMTTTRAVQQEVHTGPSDLLGTETRSKTGGFFGFGGGGASSSRAGPGDSLLRLFSIGQRELTLTSIARDAIILHIASQTNLSYSYERIFKSSLQLLVDTATAEAEFLWGFFGPGYGSQTANSPFIHTAEPTKDDDFPAGDVDADDSSFEKDFKHDEGSANDEFIAPISEALGMVSVSDSLTSASKSSAAAALSTAFPLLSVKSLVREVKITEKEQAQQMRAVSTQHAHALFSGIFSRTIAVFTADLEAFLATTHDSIGVLILLRMVYNANAELAARRLPHLNGLLDKLSSLLWTRFKQLFAANLGSVENFNLSSLKKGDTSVHFVTLRYAEYCTALHRLNRSYGDEFITTSLATLRLEIEVLLARLSSRVAGSHVEAGMIESLTLRDKKNKLAFLVNNLVALCRILRAKDVSYSPEFARFAELLTQSTAGYVEEELAEHFSGIVTFVKETEVRLAGMSLAEVQAKFVSSFDPKHLQQVIKHFIATWKESMKTLAANVTKYFSCQDEISLSSAPTLPSAQIASPSDRNSRNWTSPNNMPRGSLQPTPRASLPASQSSPGRHGKETLHEESESDNDSDEDSDEDDAFTSETALVEVVAPLLQDLSGEVLKKTLLQLVFYYRRFQDLLEKMYPNPSSQPAFVCEMISIQNIVYEIKKYGARS